MGSDNWGKLDWIGLKPEISIEVIGEGAEAEILLQDGYFVGGVNYDVTHDDQETSHSIHSPGSAPSVICVGASSHRTAILNYEGVWRIFDQGTNGRRADYSSVGPTFDGRIKPDVMAPGNNIISSYSSFYCETHPTASDIASNVSVFDFNGRSYAWNSNAGTSMATPVVAGAIALWLQAKPDLSPQQALDVISRTARQYTDTLSYPNNYYGYGEIDVYNGLLAVLQLDVVDGISHHQPAAARISLTKDRQLSVTVPSGTESPLTIRLFNLKGQQVWSRSTVLPPFSLLLPPELKGVYVVQLDGSPAITGSTLIRL
jgi:subtilisin family serine protease